MKIVLVENLIVTFRVQLYEVDGRPGDNRNLFESWRGLVFDDIGGTREENSRRN